VGTYVSTFGSSKQSADPGHQLEYFTCEHEYWLIYRVIQENINGSFFFFLLISKKYPINLVLLLLFDLFRCHWALIRVASQQVKKEASSKRVSGLLKGRRRYYYYQTYLFDICVNQVPSNQISSFAWDLEKAHG
jgi:hypothetical protein